MKWIESILTYCFPAIMFEGRPWRAMWEEKEQRQFVAICRVFFFAAGFAYIGHFFFYDIPMGLQPIEKWLWFRLIAAGTSFAAMFFYLSPLAYGRFSKLPAIFATWLFCYTQAMITTWWEGTPWLYSFLFVAGTLMVVRASPLATVLLATIYMASQAPFHLASGVPLSSVISTAFVTTMLLLLLKSSHVADVRNFVLSQENIAAQRKLIELNIEFSDRLKAFIPKVIADRIETLVTQKRVSVLQAAVDVLKPRKVNVSCLFSDIRGFTKGSRDLDAFINRSVLPEMKACSNVVEEFSGIPRKIGDLIFAYFDDENRSNNVIRCLMAAIAISRVNQELNSRGSRNEIRRYILVSTGEAVVGNLGGLDSSIEITALGPPVNFLSRLDELTKNPYLSSRLIPGDVLVCESTIAALSECDVDLAFDSIDLAGNDLVVRDFPDVHTVFRLRDPIAAYESLQAWQFPSNNLGTVSSGESYNQLRYAG